MSPAGRQVHYKAMRRLAAEHPSEKIGEEVCQLYSWNNEERTVHNIINDGDTESLIWRYLKAEASAKRVVYSVTD